MRNLLFILLLIPVFGLSQSNYTTIASIPEGVQAYFWYEGHRYTAWKTPGWSGPDNSSVVDISLGGQGQSTAQSMWAIKPMPELISGSWNGTLVKNNGEVIKYLFIGVRDTSQFSNAYYTTARNLIGHIITSTGIDTMTAPPYKIQLRGLSNGSNWVSRIKAGGGSGHAWSNYVKRVIHAAHPVIYATGTPVWQNYNGSKVRVHTTTNDNVTPEGLSADFNTLLLTQTTANSTLKIWDDDCHCAWNYAYSVSGLTDPPGTHAPDSNEWRIMVDDVEYVPPVVNVPVRIRIKE